MKLEDTTKMMCSKNYKDRFRAEYAQLMNRYNSLKFMLHRWDKGTLDFTPTCDKGTLKEQLKAMATYIDILEARAEMENISLADLQ